ncbi:MAG: DUF1588 domain-containing protein [Myxococcota bacterium]
MRSTFAFRAALRSCLLVAFAASMGCGETPTGAPTECISTERFFSERVWSAFMANNCFACHNGQGMARDTDLVLQSPNQPGFLQANLNIVENIAGLERDGVSVLLLKPSLQIDHGGGKAIEQGGEEYKALEELIGRFKAPVACEEAATETGMEDLLYLDERETLRKASLLLVGRLPTSEELTRVMGGGDAALEEALDGMMQEADFYVRLKQMFNDLLLTDRYLNGNRAVDLLDGNDYPERRFYENLDEATTEPAYYDASRTHTNRSVAREPLELIAHVVRNDRPFSEVLTADYTMLNPFSARVYGVSDVNFADPLNPDDFQPARVPGIPHAGVLTSPMFLNRFPTTATNRNRHRARMVYQFFLATDVQLLAERPVDPSSIVDHNPTMNNPQCTVCHENIDPVAGTFQNWDDKGRYRPPEEGWFADMRPPGYHGENVPAAEWGSSRSWLGQKIGADPLFALAAVHNLHRGLTGQAPLRAPSDIGDPNYFAELYAYETQDKVLQQIAKRFADSGYNLKTAIKGVLLSPYFRTDEATKGQPNTSPFGTARFLSPELLDRKIEAVLGYPWARGWDKQGYLLRSDEFMIFYGGIDSDTITQRLTEPNGLMSAIAQRMANEMACTAVSRDFTLEKGARLLFPHVERSFEPEDENGFEVPGAVAAITENLQWLHERVLGESVGPDSVEVERAFALFLETWREGKAGIRDDSIDENLPWQCRAEKDYWTDEVLSDERKVTRDDRYTVRAWMAVLSFLLTDYRFLFE